MSRRQVEPDRAVTLRREDTVRSLVPVPNVRKQPTRGPKEGNDQPCLLSHDSGRLSELPVAAPACHCAWCVGSTDVRDTRG